MILARAALVRPRTMLANVVRGPTKSYGSGCADATHAGMKPKAAQDLSPESLSTPHEPSTWCAACSRSARRYGSPLYRCASGLAAESYRPAEKFMCHYGQAAGLLYRRFTILAPSPVRGHHLLRLEEQLAILAPEQTSRRYSGSAPRV